MSAKPPAPAARRLLIIDDDQDFAIATSRALALEGLDCRIAHDGATALAKLEVEPVEVALLDIRLGHEDGVELAGRLLTRHPQMIVVIMTAYASVDSALAALKLGAYDFLRKPFFLNQLMQALERCYELVELRAAKALAERQLVLTSKLEATAQLATGLSHDLKNMLAVIQANLCVLEDGLSAEDRLAHYAQDAREAVGTAAQLIDRLMGFARHGPNAALNIVPRVAETVAMLQRSLCAGMKIELQLPPHPIWVNLPPGQIETALINLMINARDATEGRGAIEITLSQLRRGGDYARLQVDDDGPGLAEVTQARVMEPLFTTKRDGTGLGLPMIQHLALSQGGSFSIGTGRHGGASAVLELPCQPLTDQASPSGENI